MSVDLNDISFEDLSLEEFILSPYTAAVVLRSNDLANLDLSDTPNIRLGKELSGNFVIVYIRIDLLEPLYRNNKSINYSLAMGLFSQFDLNAAGISAVQQQPYLSLRGGGVLLGFIDTGIDYTKSAFCWEDGTTKIRNIWDQTITGMGAPFDFNFGFEFTANNINKALKSDDPYSVVPHRDTVGHGTFLASLAGSHEPGMYAGAAPDAEFVIVKIKEISPYYRDLYMVPSQYQDVYESVDLMLGIDYIITKAQELNRPVAICIGIGTNLGSHDGFSALEDFVSGVSYINGVSVCCAAGNESAVKRHATGRVEATGATATVEFRSSENTESVYLSIWNSLTDRLSASLISPTGESISRVPARSGETTTTRLIMENARVMITYRFPYSGNSAQLTVIRISDPTPGIWRLQLYGELILDGVFHIWLPISGMGSSGIDFLTPDPNYTVTVPATAVGIIACGAYSTRDNSLYELSSWGPSRLHAAIPDLAAPGVDVGGIFPSDYGIMSGTSAAAAITAGACALLLEWGLILENAVSMNTYHVRSVLIQGCERDTWLEYPNDQWGYGRLNLYNSFLSLRST
ncbi:MAG: S8 family peptidase [Clostridiales bacterium]|jgi:subtilisin family serine protease|nr:S8 family peptidase [Clostridiales bacterium]